MTGAAHKNKNSHVVLRGETPGAKEREDDNWYVKELTSSGSFDHVTSTVETKNLPHSITP